MNTKILLPLFLFILVSYTVSAQRRWPCDGSAYTSVPGSVGEITINKILPLSGINATTTTYGAYPNPTPGVLTSLFAWTTPPGSPAQSMNSPQAIGYNIKNGLIYFSRASDFIYGVSNPNTPSVDSFYLGSVINTLYKVDFDGNVSLVPINENVHFGVAGYVDKKGYYYNIKLTQTNRGYTNTGTAQSHNLYFGDSLFVINLNTSPAQVVGRYYINRNDLMAAAGITAAEFASSGFVQGDMIVNPVDGGIYVNQTINGGTATTSKVFGIYKITPPSGSTGQATVSRVYDLSTTDGTGITQYNGQWSDYLGNHYGANGANIYKFTNNTAPYTSVTYLTSAPPPSNASPGIVAGNDGCSCSFDTIGLQKTYADASIPGGTATSATYNVQNFTGFPQTNATFTDALPNQLSFVPTGSNATSTAASIKSYLEGLGIYGTGLSVTISNGNGGTDNVLTITGITIPVGNFDGTFPSFNIMVQSLPVTTITTVQNQAGITGLTGPLADDNIVSDYPGSTTNPDPTPLTLTTSLSVNFGIITAKISDGKLEVNWGTLKESNNSYFEVQASIDGVNFTNLGKVNSKALNGNSGSVLAYRFNVDYSMALNIAFGLLVLGTAFRSRKKLIAVVIGVITFAGVFNSCAKKDTSNINNHNKVFVRIAQTDIDGTRTYSRTVQAVFE